MCICKLFGFWRCFLMLQLHGAVHHQCLLAAVPQILACRSWSLSAGLASGTGCCHCKPSPSEPIACNGLKGFAVDSGELLGNVRHSSLVFPPSSLATVQTQCLAALSPGRFSQGNPFCPSSSSHQEEAWAAMGAVLHGGDQPPTPQCFSAVEELIRFQCGVFFCNAFFF